MKNFILIPLLFIALTNVYSQSYFPKEGASWHMAKSASGSGDLFPVFSKFSVLGDTNLDSKKIL